jgi:hypothetical protein
LGWRQQRQQHGLLLLVLRSLMHINLLLLLLL